MGPRQVVRARPAAPPRVGLIASAILPDEPDERWVNGFAYEPESCGGAGRGDVCSDGQTPKDAAPNAAIVEYDPILVYAVDKCSTWDQTRDREGRARRLLAACEGTQLEAELWTGSQALAEDPATPNNRLASPASDVLSNGPMSAGQALACLEQGLADCGCGSRGMIHAPRGLVSHWASLQLVRRDGALIVTTLDTIVVPGAGYDGSGPNGEPAGVDSTWAYATDMVEVRRGAIRLVGDGVAERLDRSNNDLVTVAERPVAATFDGCCHLAVETDVDLCTLGGPGS